MENIWILPDGWRTSGYYLKEEQVNKHQYRMKTIGLTVGGADEGEAGHDPEEGHGEEDDVFRDACSFILKPAGARANQSSLLLLLPAGPFTCPVIGC